MSEGSFRDLEGKDYDGPRNQYQPVSLPNRRLSPSQGEYNFVDSSDPLFSMYSKAAEGQDIKMVESWRKDADEILIFTGLFSAAVAALLAVSVQNLTPSSQDISAFHLGNIYELLADSNATRTSIRSPVTKPPSFSPPRYAIWVNSLWFLSLVISLTCALLASSTQQWARRYLRVTQSAGYSPEKRARIRAFFANGVDILPNAWVVEGLPTLLHLSLFLFFAGLVIFLFNTNQAVFSSVFWWIGLFSIAYALITLMPFVRHDSPYYSPLSLSAWFLYASISHFFFTVRFSMLSDRLVDFRTWRRLRALRDRYRRWITGGVEKAAEEMVSERPSDMDFHILGWIIGAFADDDRIEEFFEAIPGFFNSKLVKVLGSDLPNNLLKRFWEAANGFFVRTLLSNSVIEPVKSRRLNIGMTAMSVISAPRILPILNDILSEPWDQVPQNVEMGYVMADWCSSENKVIAQYAQCIATRILATVRERNDRWIALATGVFGLPVDNLRAYIAHGDDSLSLAILISVARRHIHSDFYDWGLLSTLYRLDIHNTLPELQHAFCMLWNECIEEAGRQPPDAFPLGILRLTRFLYIRLHEGTDAASRLFSASTPDFDHILYRTQLYPLCDIQDHHSDSTIFDSIPQDGFIPPRAENDYTIHLPPPHEMAQPVAPSSPTLDRQPSMESEPLMVRDPGVRHEIAPLEPESPGSTTISQFELVSDPSGSVSRQSRRKRRSLSVIPDSESASSDNTPAVELRSIPTDRGSRPISASVPHGPPLASPSTPRSPTFVQGNVADGTGEPDRYVYHRPSYASSSSSSSESARVIQQTPGRSTRSLARMSSLSSVPDITIEAPSRSQSQTSITTPHGSRAGQCLITDDAHQHVIPIISPLPLDLSSSPVVPQDSSTGQAGDPGQPVLPLHNGQLPRGFIPMTVSSPSQPPPPQMAPTFSYSTPSAPTNPAVASPRMYPHTDPRALYGVPVPDASSSSGRLSSHNSVRVPVTSTTGESSVMVPPASIFSQPNELSTSETDEDEAVASSIASSNDTLSTPPPSRKKPKPKKSRRPAYDAAPITPGQAYPLSPLMRANTLPSSGPGDGPRMRVAGDGPQRAQRHRAKPSPEGGNLEGVMSSSPPDSAGKSRDPNRPEKLFGNAVDARPLPSRPLFTSISPHADTGRSTVDEGKAQQRTGSEDMANRSGDRVRLENPRKPSAQSQRTGVASPAYLDPEQDRDDDTNILLARRPSSRTGNSGGRPSRAVERDEQPHPGTAHSRSRAPPSTERDQPNQSMHPITLPSNTMHREVTAAGQRSQSRRERETYSETKVNLPPPPNTRVRNEQPSSCRIC